MVELDRVEMSDDVSGEVDHEWVGPPRPLVDLQGHPVVLSVVGWLVAGDARHPRTDKA